MLEPYLHSTTFMYVSSTNSSRFKRSNVVKSHCQSSPWSTESKFQKTVSERRGRPIQSLATAWRACSASASTSRAVLPNESQRLAHSLFISPFPLAISLSIVLLHASAVTGKTVTAAEPNHPNRAPLSDSPEPQHHRELLHVLDLTEASSSPQVELTVKAAPPGRHDRRRPSSHVAVPLEPLIAPSFSCFRSS